jgi:hypothetical protein
MGQRVVSWLICNDRFRVHAINGVGERKGRIIEVEEVATGERAHGSSLLMVARGPARWGRRHRWPDYYLGARNLLKRVRLELPQERKWFAHSGR